MNLRCFIVILGFILGFWKGFAFPECNAVLSIQAFEKLDSREKLNKIHPYLHQAFCNADRKEQYLKLYLDTFAVSEGAFQRLNELKYLLHNLELEDNALPFLDFFGVVLDEVGKRYPNVKNDLIFINLKFSYYNRRFGNAKACSYLYNYSGLANSDAPKTTDLFKYFIALSKCAESSDDYNASVYYLIQALEVTKNFDYPVNRLKSGHVFKFLSNLYYELEDYKNTEKYADSAINTFLPEFKLKNGLAVAFENKALALHQLTGDTKQALTYLDNAQEIYKKIENSARYHYVDRLKAEVLLIDDPDLATQYLFTYINFSYANKSRIHYAKGWLLAHRIIKENQLEHLELSPDIKVTSRQIIDTLTALLPNEKLKMQLEISSAIIEYYSLFKNTDSLIKYNELQNKLEAARNKLTTEQRQTNLNLYLTNHHKEQELASLNLLNQKQSYQNKLLSGLICLVVGSLIFYYFYKRKQRQIILARLQLKESEHEKLRTQQKLKEELILRKEQNEKLLKLAYDNEVKRKQLLQLQLKEKQNEVEAAQLEKQSNINLLNEVFIALKDDSVNNASHLIRKLRRNDVITRHNDSLKEIFKSISPVLMESLERINPDLTDQDILYCALIRQNYSTQQIADFLNISPKSVNQHKYRLKKKLELDRNISISSFLKDLSLKEIE
ncbi:LuxR C-terminal-related transcriptional regulator [Aequorivita viscosa]|uniref:Regulatory protein, luxR family n=1 Tax=Aequorivita viscosa TaxID=797419 RepID=A0A1M6PDI2_9FLAO|nr:LuxR C-terminal-related transcriptional regulator [Aequorivita viscosa]SDX53774.1 regulatory protein, luxR family [Aequorivita viscosa]SHK06015.1 regulatory protein, luxR family [Aequorivita viscosa]